MKSKKTQLPKEFTIICKGEFDEKYEGCNDCKFSSDPLDICYMRRCIHALHNTKAYELYTKEKKQ